MKLSDLLTPGVLSNGLRLRVEAMKAINAADRNHTVSGTADTQVQLRKFFAACAASVGDLRRTVGPAPYSVYTYNVDKTWVIIEFDANLDPQFLADVGDFTFSPAKTVTNVGVHNNKVFLRLSAAVASGFTVAYAANGGLQLKDKSGNVVPTFTAQAGTIVS